MHEMSLAGGILKIVEEASQREGFFRVTRLVLEVGKLSGVEIESLRFAMDALAPGTCLKSAVLEIREPPGQAVCLGCGNVTKMSERGDACEHCGSYRLEPTSGTELRVMEMLVEDN